MLHERKKRTSKKPTPGPGGAVLVPYFPVAAKKNEKREATVFGGAAKRSEGGGQRAMKRESGFRLTADL